MVKWKKEGNGFGAYHAGWQVLFVIYAGDDGWWWHVAESDTADNAAEGYAPTKAQAQACAVAVATALGWIKDEAKPKRVLVQEWWEVRRGSEVVPGFSRFLSALGAKAHRDRLGPRGCRIVHVRRYKR